LDIRIDFVYDLEPRTSFLDSDVDAPLCPVIRAVSMEQVDTSTPTGKMIFTVLGAVAELE